jgi:transcriptional regulator GlxA family with amidase domain
MRELPSRDEAFGADLVPGGPRVVVLVAFDGFQMLDVAGPMEVFSKASLHARPGRCHAGQAGYRVIVASPAGGAIASSAGLEVGGTCALEDVEEGIDTIMVAGAPEAALRQALGNQALMQWLSRRAPHTRRVASVCTGAFILAAAGLLNDRRAATHWEAARTLAAVFPRVQVVADAIYVGDGHVFTSAGVTAGLDLTLAFVEQDLGSRVALQAARDLVLYLRRAGGQSQFSSRLAAQAKGAGSLHGILEWIDEHPDADLSVPTLAERAAMSERTFARAFLAQTGMTPARYVELVRLDQARRFLEATSWPLARIADRSGLGSAATLSRAFRRRLGVTPQLYRARFGLQPDAASGGRTPLS